MYQHKTTPFKHQAELFDASKDDPAMALFWEQGCGKTKPTIDTAAHLYEAGEIDAIIVVAPNGVHRNWITDELPAHMPDHVAAKMMAVYFDTDKAGNKATQAELQKLLNWPGLAVLTISYSGFCTFKRKAKDPDKGRDFAGKFMRKRRCLMVADESHYAKNPTADRTKTLMAASKFAPYRRILTGTPIAQGPFDIYSQVQILDEDFWVREAGISSFSGFKTEFGVWQNKPFGPGGRNISVCVAYKNLPRLQELLAKVGHRLTKEDAGLNLPPKVYSKRYVELTADQRAAYATLKAQMYLELEQGIVEAPLAITMLLRFQQIVCGYAGDTEGKILRIGKTNPRLEVMEDIASQTLKQGIIWARFTEDINQIMDLLGNDAVRYDGSMDADDRADAKAAFQAGDKKWFVGNQAAGATGLTLTQAKTVVYYSNSFRLVDRLQSEDRAHRIGQDESVNYIDLVATNTVDERIVNALRNKMDVATMITGDTVKEWI